MMMRSTVLLLAAVVTGAAYAMRLSVGDAECAARAFASEGRHLGARIGSFPSAVREHSVADGSNFFSVRMSGGGTVFLSGDDEREPVIAFTSADVDFDSLDRDSPLYALLERDARVRRGTSGAKAKWRRLLEKGDAAPAYPSLLSLPLFAAAIGAPGDIRVPALVDSIWEQTNDRSGNPCFNLYTPDNRACGCVATAMGQLMHYHRWPDAEHPVQAKTVRCGFGQSSTDYAYTNLTMQGGVYDWDLMPTDADGDRIATAGQRQAIGKLTGDAGISVKMVYTPGGSGTIMSLVSGAMMDTWRYGQATYLFDYYLQGAVYNYGYINGEHGAEQRAKVLQQACFSNLDAGYPVMLGITGNGGHCVIADGYGYDDGVDYIHLNMGWAGQDDTWYNLPSIGTRYKFSTVDDMVYNIFPTNGTSYAAFSGRILDPATNAIAGASVKIYRSGTSTPVADLISSDSGVYGAVLQGGRTYDVVAVSPDLAVTGTVSGVVLYAPDADDRQISDCSRGLTTEDELGNSWGNDIILDATRRVTPTNFYVSASLGIDAPERGTAEEPYATIQYAITNGQSLCSGDVINVLPGTYFGCIETPSASISIVATDGPEVTLIDGEGRDCCYYGAANQANLLSGFTITNGAYYGGIYIGTATNCIIVRCENSEDGVGGGAYAAYLYGCVLHNNQAFYGGGAGASTLVNCTVYDNWAGYAGGGVDCDCALTNCIVWRNVIGNYNDPENWQRYVKQSWRQTTVYTPSFANCCTYPLVDAYHDFGGNITNDPKCVSLNVDDYRLREGSPCLGAGLWDLNMGAWQGDGVRGYEIIASVRGKGKVSPWSQFVPEGGEATFTAIGDHPFLGIETNGVFAAAEKEFTWRDIRADGTLTACFGVTNYCVDASTGDDSNDGFTWETPLRSLNEAIFRTGEGDKVRIGPGFYESCGYSMYGVEVESTDGAASTIIDGGGTNCCVYSDGAILRGLSFINGYAAPSFAGGGAYGGTFVDCVFSNCSASYGGGVYGAVLTNCLVESCWAYEYQSGWYLDGGIGGGTYECRLVNCTLSGNSADYCAGGALINDYGEARNSIICGNTCAAGSANGNDAYGNNYWTMSNSFSDVDAKFRDPANGDYRLLPTSPAIDAGSLDFVTLDHDLAGTNRVWGLGVDAGCYEYHLPSSSMADPGVIVGDSAAVVSTKVSAALATEGYKSAYIDAITTLKDYSYLVEWTAAANLTAADLNASPTGLISPALGSAGLLSLSPTNIVFQSFAILAPEAPASAPGDSALDSANANSHVVEFSFTLPGYDLSKLNLPLLNSALDLLSSASLPGPYASTPFTYTPTTSGITLRPSVSSSPSRFYKLDIR